jgi:hypothetical protein
MGRHHYVGWWGSAKLFHCNYLDGWSLCKTQNPPSYLPDDYYCYGWTREDILAKGGKLCSVCNSRKNQGSLALVDRTILTHHRPVEKEE